MSALPKITFALAWILVSSCTQQSADDLAAARQPLDYGDDDRRDLFQLTDPELRTLAYGSTAALIDAAQITPVDTHFEVRAQELGASARLCPESAFQTQTVAATCSAVVVDDDLILTAGHCQDSCTDQRWTFGYALSHEGQAPTLERDDLYGCRSVPLRAHAPTTAGGRIQDFALVQLDHPLTPDKQPVLLAEIPPAVGQAVIVIGYPEGLPVKIDRGARVLADDPGAGYFEVSSDTYVGSSGSGVFDDQLRLIGIIVRGGLDYEFDRARNCYVRRRLAENSQSLRGEKAVYAAPIIAALCADGWASQRLCGHPRPCGDGACHEACVTDGSDTREPLHEHPPANCALISSVGSQRSGRPAAGIWLCMLAGMLGRGRAANAAFRLAAKWLRRRVGCRRSPATKRRRE